MKEIDFNGHVSNIGVEKEVKTENRRLEANTGAKTNLNYDYDRYGRNDPNLIEETHRYKRLPVGDDGVIYVNQVYKWSWVMAVCVSVLVFLAGAFVWAVFEDKFKAVVNQDVQVEPQVNITNNVEVSAPTTNQFLINLNATFNVQKLEITTNNS